MRHMQTMLTTVSLLLLVGCGQVADVSNVEGEDGSTSEAASIAAEMGFETVVSSEMDLVALDTLFYDRVAECMRRQGFEFVPLPAGEPATSFVSETDEIALPDGSTVPREEYVSSFGYGVVAELLEEFENMRSYEPVEDPNDAYFESLSAEERNAFVDAISNPERGCMAVASASFDEGEATSNLDYDALLEAAQEDVRVIEFVDEWSRCMRSQGYDYLDPSEPIEELEEQASEILESVMLGVTSGQIPIEEAGVTQIEELSQLQQVEIEVALADHECGDAQFAGQELLDSVVDELGAKGG